MTHETQTQPEIPIQKGDYIVRSGRVLEILDVIGEGKFRRCETVRIMGARLQTMGDEIAILLPEKPYALGRRYPVSMATVTRDRRYRHVRATLAIPFEGTVEAKPEAVPETPPVLSGDDLIRAHLDALERSIAATDRLREALEKLGTKGQQEIRFPIGSANGAQRAAG
jgi:hypothetical protein